MYRNFGMPQPNGYRKAMRYMRMAEHFGWPIITFIDTPGAFAGKTAEDLGQVPLPLLSRLSNPPSPTKKKKKKKEEGKGRQETFTSLPSLFSLCCW